MTYTCYLLNFSPMSHADKYRGRRPWPSIFAKAQKMSSTPSPHSSLCLCANIILIILCNPLPPLPAWVPSIRNRSKMGKFSAGLYFPFRKLLFSFTLPGCPVSSVGSTLLPSTPVFHRVYASPKQLEHAKLTCPVFTHNPATLTLEPWSLHLPKQRNPVISRNCPSSYV